MPSQPRIAALSMLLFSACVPAASLATIATVSTNPPARPVVSVTQTTPHETTISEPAATVPFPARGPYFAFLNMEERTLVLTLIGTDAAGRREIPLSGPLDTGNCFACIISPDGEWLAYWTGGYGPDTPTSEAYPHDLQLNLLNIPNGTIMKVARLLSPEYPAEQDSYFFQAIKSAAWSPDSRYLAFAGEIDGPSSDLYVFNVEKQSVLRLSSGSTDILSSSGQAIRWSPDGKWIVYSAGDWWGEGMKVTFFAARPDGSGFREYPNEVTNFEGWVSNSVFLVTQDENGKGSYGLESDNLDTGRSSMIWKCPYRSYAMDPEGLMLVFQDSPWPPEWGCTESGLFFKKLPAGGAKMIFDPGEMPEPSQIGYLGQGERRFLFHFWQSGTYAVSAAGETTTLVDTGLFPSISPDRQWAAFFGEELRIMDSSGEISGLLSGIQIDMLLWRPDSAGFLFLSGSNLYSVSLPEKIVTKLDGISYPPEARIPYWQPDSQGFFFQSGSDLYFLSLREKSLEFIQPLQSLYWFDPVWVAVPE